MSMEDEKAVGRIKESLDFLDSSVKVETPDINEFVKLVNSIEERKKRANQLQFVYFIITAIFLVSLETYTFYKSFIFFVCVQIFAVVSVVAFLTLKTVNRNRQVKKI